jgi:hypothetical protein
MPDVTIDTIVAGAIDTDPHGRESDCGGAADGCRVRHLGVGRATVDRSKPVNRDTSSGDAKRSSTTPANDGSNERSSIETAAQASFDFVPTELSDKCRGLIESYHAMYGFGRLADMLWNTDARAVIESNAQLLRIFKSASKSRGAKRANNTFIHIATIVMALEVLARDFAGWGKRYPQSRRLAEQMFDAYPARPRTWLMDSYLYPPPGMRRDFAGALAISEVLG